MHELNPLVALGRASLALCQQCVGASLQAMEHAHRLHIASLQALWGGAEAALVLGSDAMRRRAPGLGLAAEWGRATEVFGMLPHGLSHLLAEYADDMGETHLPPSARTRAGARLRSAHASAARSQ